MEVSSWNGFKNYHSLLMKNTKMETYHLRVVIHANSVLGCFEIDSVDSNTRKIMPLLS